MRARGVSEIVAAILLTIVVLAVGGLLVAQWLYASGIYAQQAMSTSVSLTEAAKIQPGIEYTYINKTNCTAFVWLYCSGLPCRLLTIYVGLQPYNESLWINPGQVVLVTFTLTPSQCQSLVVGTTVPVKAAFQTTIIEASAPVAS